MFRIITIPFNRTKKLFEEEVLNDFLLNKRLNYFRAEFFRDNDDAYWSVFLDYDALLDADRLESPKRPEAENPVRELDEPQRLLLERLAAWRKERAQRDGVPVYIVATNKELVAVVKMAPAVWKP